jgi:hypothetical protein
MKFRASFCDPFNPNIIELGEIPIEKIIEKFESIHWNDILTKMKSVKPNEIFYSPSLEIENIDNKNGVTVSAINEKEWYIFFKRPKKTKLLGLFEKLNKNYLTEVHGQTTNDVKECIYALINENLDYLEARIK